MHKPKTTEPVRRLTDQEIADLRADMQQAAEWTRKELARRRQEKIVEASQPLQPAPLGLGDELSIEVVNQAIVLAPKHAAPLPR